MSVLVSCCLFQSLLLERMLHAFVARRDLVHSVHVGTAAGLKPKAP